jgi:hypothetical protein
MGRKKMDPADRRQVLSVTLPQEVIDALQGHARKRAAKLDKRVTGSDLVEAMIRKYIMKEQK